jgi:glycosyltransferase involved in cell wall biosynthesis
VTGRSVLFVHGSDEAYGADRVVLDQMVGLAERGWAVRLVLPDDTAPGWLTRSATEAGIGVERLPVAVARRRYLRPRGLPGYLVGLVRARRRLRAVVERQRPTIVHINTSALLVGAILGRPAGIRLVWHIHEIIVRPRLLSVLFRSVPPLAADRVVAVSDAVRVHLAGGSRAGRTITIRNGLASRVPAPLPELVDPGAGPVVAYVGRLNRWKGYEVFVDAIARVAPAVPDARFVIAGDPPPGEEWRTADLAERIERAGLADRVRLLGLVPDGAAVFDASAIAVVPSTWPDPLPTVILEAMRAGCAVIAADHGGAPEMIDVAAGSGVLVPPGDAAALALEIVRLLEDPAARARMGAAARQRVAVAFGSTRMIDDLEALYRGLLDAKAPE